MHRIIFICSGNLCRSVMAKYLFEAEVHARGLSAVCASMGTLNIEGASPPAHVIRVMREIDIDVRAHLSQGLKAHVLTNADHVFVMESIHDRILRHAVPSLSPRLLGRLDEETRESAPRDPEIVDPIGGTVDGFRECRERITRCIRVLVSQLDAAG